jgi:hypothetical protein
MPAHSPFQPPVYPARHQKTQPSSLSYYHDGNATSAWSAAAWRGHARDVVVHLYNQEIRIGMGTADLPARTIPFDYPLEEEQAQQ